MHVLYFDYGSNLGRDDFAQWCEGHGHGRRLEPIGAAWLPDHRLVFGAASRENAALDVEAHVASAVPGVLFDVDGAMLAALDAKAADRCVRVERMVLDPQGHERRAWMHEIDRGGQPRPSIAPRREDLARGLRAFDRPLAALEAAASGDTRPWPRAVFAYGTLMRHEVRHRLLARHGIEQVVDATIEGALIDLGEYPGLIEGPGTVHGEWIAVGAIERAIRMLDVVEEFLGYGASGSLYRRVIVCARTRDDERFAWAYRFVGRRMRAPRIASGSWRNR